MLKQDFSEFVKKKVSTFPYDKIIFTKKDISYLESRNGLSEGEMKEEIFNPKNLKFVEKQEREFRNSPETRYLCYFVHSNSKGRAYVLKFNSNIKIVTVFPIGKKTLRKYARTFK